MAGDAAIAVSGAVTYRRKATHLCASIYRQIAFLKYVTYFIFVTHQAADGDLTYLGAFGNGCVRAVMTFGVFPDVEKDLFGQNFGCTESSGMFFGECPENRTVCGQAFGDGGAVFRFQAIKNCILRQLWVRKRAAIRFD